MKNRIITTLGGAIIGGALAFGVTSTDVLTDQQLYILTEILQDRIPQVNASKVDMQQFNRDYIEVMKFVKDDISEAVEVCQKHRGDDCNIYKRIKVRVVENSAQFE